MAIVSLAARRIGLLGWLLGLLIALAAWLLARCLAGFLACLAQARQPPATKQDKRCPFDLARSAA